VPVIMLVEGVLHSSNADHPALALAKEFGIFPQGWDGRPIVFSHPKNGEEPISANNPDLWENDVIGFLFNSGMKGKKKLRSYMYLNKSKTPKDVLKAFEDGDTVEVSTGLYALEEKTEGLFEGKEYKTIWRNVVPDHLAVLPLGSVGACSVSDGCGAPRLNSEGSPMPAATPAQQPQSQAAAPKQNCGTCDERLYDNLDKALSAFFLRSETSGLQSNELSDVDKRKALELALVEAYDSGWCYILALFSGTVVYAHFNVQDYSWVLYQRSYSVAEGGVVSLGADVSEVRPETKYVPLVIAVDQPVTSSATATMEGTHMSRPVQQQGQGQPAQPQQQATQPAAQQPASQPAVQQPVQQEQPVQPQAQQPVASAAEPKKAASLKELRDMASPEVQQQLDIIVKANTDRAAALIKSLEGKVGLSADDLKTLTLENLEKMAAKIVGAGTSATAPVDYSGGAGAQHQQAAQPGDTQEANFTPVTPMFTQDTKIESGAERPSRKAA